MTNKRSDYYSLAEICALLGWSQAKVLRYETMSLFPKRTTDDVKPDGTDKTKRTLALWLKRDVDALYLKLSRVKKPRY